MSERLEPCLKCGQVKPVAVYLQTRSGEKKALCEDCHTAWAESDEEWGEPSSSRKKSYYGPFPQP